MSLADLQGGFAMMRRNLRKDELQKATRIIVSVKKQILRLSGEDKHLAFAYLRRVWTQLQYVERGTPQKRMRLKTRLFKKQKGRCVAPGCSNELPARGSVLDRRNAIDGYVVGNVDLICPDCDLSIQTSLGYKAKPTDFDKGGTLTP